MCFAFDTFGCAPQQAHNHENRTGYEQYLVPATLVSEHAPIVEGV